MKNINRREFIKKVGIGALATGGLITACNIITSPTKMVLPDPYPELPEWKPAIPPYNEQALFLNEHQYALVATLAAIIIPSDEDPGANEAVVVDDLDRLIADSKEKQAIYKKGLKWLDKISREQYGNGFLALELNEQISLLRRIDEAETMRNRSVTGFMDRVDRKADEIWDDFFGIGENSYFFRIIHKDVLVAYFSNPISWNVVGYYGPPQPVGYLDFSEPPSPTKYTGSIRQVSNQSCLICHDDGLKHDRGDLHDRSKLIDNTCNTCHPPHSPWPRIGGFSI